MAHFLRWLLEAVNFLAAAASTAASFLAAKTHSIVQNRFARTLRCRNSAPQNSQPCVLVAAGMGFRPTRTSGVSGDALTLLWGQLSGGCFPAAAPQLDCGCVLLCHDSTYTVYAQRCVQLFRGVSVS
jgi:hypothetical protein